MEPKSTYRVYTDNYRKAEYIASTMREVEAYVVEQAEKAMRNTFIVKEYKGKQLWWRYLVSVMPYGVIWDVVIED